MNLIDEIKQLLQVAFPSALVSVSDMTGGGDHLQVEVVAKEFASLPLLKQHQMVMDVLKAPLHQKLHAVKIKTRVA